MLYPEVDKHIENIIALEVPIVFTSAGSPKRWTSHLKSHGIKVVHVVSSALFAVKSEAAGVDAIVCEGFEAGGHNGRDETTSMCLIPAVVNAVDIPVIAAGGIHDGKSMLAAMVLGAEGIQMGSRFVVTQESSAHIDFKQTIVDAQEGDTTLTLKEITPVRMIHNAFYKKVVEAYAANASQEQLVDLLGRGRSKKGMFEGNLPEGELSIGQISSMLHEIKPAGEVVDAVVADYKAAGGMKLGKRFEF